MTEERAVGTLTTTPVAGAGGAGPVAASERSEMVDVLRGFALLGILVPNILFFALPVATEGGDPHGTMPAVLAGGEATWADQAFIGVMNVAFFGKMMFIFSMLFGAGVLFFDRKGRGATGLWYRRMGWLALFGVLHGALLWFGDILLSYALAGMGLVWWARKWRPGVLLASAGGLYLFGVAAFSLLMAGFAWLGAQAGEDAASQMPRMFTIEGQIEAYRGTYLDALGVRLAFWAQFLLLFPFSWLFSVTGLMLGGMALAKWGVLTGERSARFYGALAGIGLSVGLLLSALYPWAMGRDGWAPMESAIFQGTAQLVGIPLGLGYVGLIGLVCTAAWARGTLAWMRTGLGSVGRMAFTNYIAQTLICTTLFYGHGFGLFGRLGGAELAGVVLGVWAFNIAFSVVWLRFFRFGPLEWIWRSLTYWRRHPMRRGVTASPAVA